MAVFLVTWDLNKKRSNYDEARQKLIAQLSRYPHVKDDGLDSVWFIESSAAVSAVSKDIKAAMDHKDDKLIVTQIVRDQYWGWLAQPVWDWINERV